jgi:hypothetical protein
MPILAINMFPSQHSLWRRTLEHLDRSARIEPTSSNNHFNLRSALCRFFAFTCREQRMRRLTGWKARLAALGMKPTGRCGPPKFGLRGIDNFDNVSGFVGSENP